MTTAMDLVSTVHDATEAELRAAVERLPKNELEKLTEALRLASCNSSITVSIADLGGQTLWGPHVVALSMAVSELLEKLADMRKPGTVLKLSHDGQVLECTQTLGGQKVPEGALLTAIHQNLESRVFTFDGTWQHRWSAPSSIRQMAIGPYDAYALLEDGSVWYVGHTEGEGWTRGPCCLGASLASLGAIRWLCIDYTHPIVITESDEVWTASILGDSVTQGLQTLCLADRRTFEAAFSNKEGDDIAMDVTRLDRLCGLSVTDIVANQMFGLAITGSGKVFFFGALNQEALEDMAGLDLDASVLDEPGEDDPERSEAFEAFVFSEVDLGAQRAVKISLEGILLDNGEITLLRGSRCHRLSSGSCCVVGSKHACIEDESRFSGVVDISMHRCFGLLALDKEGHLWNGSPMQRVQIAPGTSRGTRFAGQVMVASGIEDELAFCGAVQVAKASRIGSMGCQYLAEVAWVDVPHSLADSTVIFAGAEMSLGSAIDLDSDYREFLSKVNTALAFVCPQAILDDLGISSPPMVADLFEKSSRSADMQKVCRENLSLDVNAEAWPLLLQACEDPEKFCELSASNKIFQRQILQALKTTHDEGDGEYDDEEE